MIEAAQEGEVIVVTSLDRLAGHGQIWCMGSRGGACLGLFTRLAIAELDALDQLPELLRSIQLPPGSLGGLGELENRREGRLARQASLGTEFADPEELDKCPAANVILVPEPASWPTVKANVRSEISTDTQ